MDDWKKHLATYADCCFNAGFYGTAFRLRTGDLALSEALSVVNEMKCFISGYLDAASRSSDKEKLIERITPLAEQTEKLWITLTRRKALNRDLLG